MAKSGKQRTKKAAREGVRKASKAAGVEVISSELRYAGPLFHVYTDWIRENGMDSRRDVVRHGGSTVILAVDDSGKPDPLVVVERQYRHASGKYLLEIPAGTLNLEEDPLRGAKRELAEETGLHARRWRKLTRFYPSPGFLGEWMQIYLAEGLTPGETSLDEDEQIEIEMVPLSRLLKRIESGAIEDGKTILSALLLDRIRRTGRRTDSRTTSRTAKRSSKK